MIALALCGLLKKKMADSRVRRAYVWLVVLKKQERLSQLRDETKPSLAPLFYALKREQKGLLKAIFSCLNPPRLTERSMDASPFFCVVRHGRSIFSR